MLSSQTDESDSLDIIIFLFLQCKILLIDKIRPTVCTHSGTKGSGIVLFDYSADSVQIWLLQQQLGLAGCYVERVWHDSKVINY